MPKHARIKLFRIKQIQWRCSRFERLCLILKMNVKTVLLLTDICVRAVVFRIVRANGLTGALLTQRVVAGLKTNIYTYYLIGVWTNYVFTALPRLCIPGKAVCTNLYRRLGDGRPSFSPALWCNSDSCPKNTHKKKRKNQYVNEWRLKGRTTSRVTASNYFLEQNAFELWRYVIRILNTRCTNKTL